MLTYADACRRLLTYADKLVLGKDLNARVLRAIARHGIPGRTRVAMHTTIDDQPPAIRNAFRVLTTGYPERDRDLLVGRGRKRVMTEAQGMQVGGERDRQRDRERERERVSMGIQGGSTEVGNSREGSGYNSRRFLGTFVVLELKHAVV
jgi:hypothetical protein